MDQRPVAGKRFSASGRIESFAHAGRGVRIFFAGTPNAWLHTAILAIVILLGFYFHLARFEWMALIFAGGLVFAAEAFNTAVEIDLDLTSPDYHPRARDAKDVAAGAVLMSATVASIIGVLIFYPHIVALLRP